MKQENRFGRFFLSNDQQLGQDLIEKGLTHVLSLNDERMVVCSSDEISLSKTVLQLRGPFLQVNCSCKKFKEGGRPCRHAWAAVLEALELQSDPKNRFHLDSIDYVATGDVPLLPVVQGERKPSDAPPDRPRVEPWKTRLIALEQRVQTIDDVRPLPGDREILYIVRPLTTSNIEGKQGIEVEIACRERLKNGAWSKNRRFSIRRNEYAELADAADRRILAMLDGAPFQEHWAYGYHRFENSIRTRVVAAPLAEIVLAEMCRTGRCLLRALKANAEHLPLVWDDGPPWELWLAIEPDADGGYRLAAQVRRNEERVDLSNVRAATKDGLIFIGSTLARFNSGESQAWACELSGQAPIQIPRESGRDFVSQLLTLPSLPNVELPDELRIQEISPSPQPRLVIKKSDQPRYYRSPEQSALQGDLSFDYDGHWFRYAARASATVDKQKQVVVRRDRRAEQELARKLLTVGFKYEASTSSFRLAPKELPTATRALLVQGWRVEAEGKLYRQPGSFQLAVESGIDWFELHGEFSFGDASATLPELLAALRRGEDMVQLGDGTFGVLPEEWLKKYRVLAGMGEAHDDHVRFNRCQTGLLDALLASMPEATCDETFARVRDELRCFEKVEPADPPASFQGALRPYQRDGLGWFDFLEKFGFGGCLADDMGLGKTVQVLALLEARRVAHAASGKGRKAKRPASPRTSLVVAPRSLIFNWRQEAARFAPALKVLDHTGLLRSKTIDGLADYDLVLTTYGTLRRDAAWLKDFEFDCCILDEAQAIKNAAAESSKAVRLLKGRRRLALSGTPVENHLGELWSLFDFLNPGMLGSASVFREAAANVRNPDEDARRLLARGLRPFILRRTKKQVAKDLPDKLEQTLYCELEPKQRKLYDELRDHYRASLASKIESQGMQRAKIHILEALLRLRQAACHPGLIDKSFASEPGAKLEMLLDQLEDVLADGHKVLVFSQFTSLLAILRKRLDANGITYEYLDGQTRDRQARVERFQNDPKCQLFLISLKAGGLGLNLTAAEYVFLLDPWWNPAVESQAIDRAHRIGQTRQVFAYRLIAKDTVEEKVLQLQISKRELADAIIGADNSLIRNLAKEDLELLLS